MSFLHGEWTKSRRSGPAKHLWSRRETLGYLLYIIYIYCISCWCNVEIKFSAPQSCSTGPQLGRVQVKETRTWERWAYSQRSSVDSFVGSVWTNHIESDSEWTSPAAVLRSARKDNLLVSKRLLLCEDEDETPMDAASGDQVSDASLLVWLIMHSVWFEHA